MTVTVLGSLHNDGDPRLLLRTLWCNVCVVKMDLPCSRPEASSTRQERDSLETPDEFDDHEYTAQWWFKVNIRS